MRLRKLKPSRSLNNKKACSPENNFEKSCSSDDGYQIILQDKHTLSILMQDKQVMREFGNILQDNHWLSSRREKCYFMFTEKFD